MTHATGRRGFMAGAVGAAAGAALGCSSPERPLGPAVLDVTRERALLWTRAPREEPVHFEVATTPDFAGARRTAPSAARADTDLTVTMEVTDLAPGTRYHYRAVFSGAKGPFPGPAGTFATPADAPAPVKILWSADLLESRQPFTILDAMAAAKPDLVLLLGDLAYADHPTESPARDLAGFRRKHLGNRRDPALQRLLAAAPVAATWDDHDCDDNAHREHRLLAPARQAFREYWPLRGADAAGLHRSFSWGPHLDLFVIDARGFRDPPPKRRGRTMLGAAQKTWLKEGLKAAKARHKIIVSSVPFLAPFGNDSWFGFPEERDEIRSFIRDEKIANVTIVSGDFHLAWHLEDATAGLHEIIAGPLAAKPRAEFTKGGFMSKIKASKRFAMLDGYNYGALEISAEGRLSCAVCDVGGKERYRAVIG